MHAFGTFRGALFVPKSAGNVCFCIRGEEEGLSFP